EIPEFYHKAKRGSQANYSSQEADDLATMLKVHLDLNHLQFNLFDETENYFQFLRKLDQNPKKGKYLKSYLNINSTTSWERFYRGINQYYLYQPEDDNVLIDLLTDLRSRPVVSIEELTAESQLRFVVSLRDGGTALFTPKRFAEEERHPDHYFKTDFVSHTSEIAAFHLDRVLSMYKVPPTVGRIVNITSDILLHASKSLRESWIRNQQERFYYTWQGFKFNKHCRF
ncbi:Extracellular serine/threonine protein kinase CeFam20, partial [Bulinus truncatus]